MVDADNRRAVLYGYGHECFRSDSSVKNYLRLFGTEEMEEKYGIRGREVLLSDMKGNSAYRQKNMESYKNILGDYEYYSLCFYAGKFEKAKAASKNPKGSLGWNYSFIQDGIRLFLLYLYEKHLLSKTTTYVAVYVGFPDTKEERI